MRLLLAAALVLATTTSLAQDLYGTAHEGVFNGRTIFTRIDTATGAATPLFSFSAGNNVDVYGLAFHPGTNHFYAVAFNPAGPQFIVDIDPASGTATSFIVARALFEGIEYLPSTGGLVLTTATSGSAATNLTQISTTGTILAENAIPVVDSDSIGYDPATAALYVLDTNNPTSNATFGRLDDPTGAPTYTGIAAPTTDWDLGALNGSIFTSSLTNLVSYDATTGARTVVGPYGLAPGFGVWGVAGGTAVPEPATIAVIGLGAVGLLRRRRR